MSQQGEMVSTPVQDSEARLSQSFHAVTLLLTLCPCVLVLIGERLSCDSPYPKGTWMLFRTSLPTTVN